MSKKGHFQFQEFLLRPKIEKWFGSAFFNFSRRTDRMEIRKWDQRMDGRTDMGITLKVLESPTFITLRYKYGKFRVLWAENSGTIVVSSQSSCTHHHPGLEMLAHLKRYRQKSTDRILEQPDFAFRRGAMEENSVLTSGIRIFECCNAPGAKTQS